MSDIDFSPPVKEIPIQHRSVGLRCYADGFKRAIGHFLHGRKLQEAVEEIDSVTHHMSAPTDLTTPVESRPRLVGEVGNLLDKIDEGVA